MSIYSVYSVLITQLRLYGLMWMYALRSRTRTEHAHNPFVLMIATDAPINHIFSSNFKWKNAKQRALTNCYFGNWTWRQSGVFFLLAHSNTMTRFTTHTFLRFLHTSQMFALKKDFDSFASFKSARVFHWNRNSDCFVKTWIHIVDVKVAIRRNKRVFTVLYSRSRPFPSIYYNVLRKSELTLPAFIFSNAFDSIKFIYFLCYVGFACFANGTSLFFVLRGDVNRMKF